MVQCLGGSACAGHLLGLRRLGRQASTRRGNATAAVHRALETGSALAAPVLERPRIAAVPFLVGASSRCLPWSGCGGRRAVCWFVRCQCRVGGPLGDHPVPSVVRSQAVAHRFAWPAPTEGLLPTTTRFWSGVVKAFVAVTCGR